MKLWKHEKCAQSTWNIFDRFSTLNHRSTLGKRKESVRKLHSQHNFPPLTACSSPYSDFDVIYSLDRAIFSVFSLAKDNQSTSLTRTSSIRKNYDEEERTSVGESDKRRTKLNDERMKFKVATLQNWTAKHLNNFNFSVATIQRYHVNIKR